MGLLVFLLALVVWEVVSLFAMSGSLTGFLRDIGDPLMGMAVFFNGVYALPIVVYIALADAISSQLKGYRALIAFFGLCLIGALLLITFLSQGSGGMAQARKNGIVPFLTYPTACVVILYLVRAIRRPGRAEANIQEKQP